jgi:hypothetical protein
MGRRAREHVRDTFSVEGMVRGTADVYRRVLSGAPVGADQPEATPTAVTAGSPRSLAPLRRADG